jgi:hypothetical protein
MAGAVILPLLLFFLPGELHCLQDLKALLAQYTVLHQFTPQ